ncbi:hypothetical protein T484DRAFT_2024003, partial [Baffinella frigidus]
MVKRDGGGAWPSVVTWMVRGRWLPGPDAFARPASTPAAPEASFAEGGWGGVEEGVDEMMSSGDVIASSTHQDAGGADVTGSDEDVMGSETDVAGRGVDVRLSDADETVSLSDEMVCASDEMVSASDEIASIQDATLSPADVMTDVESE